MEMMTCCNCHHLEPLQQSSLFLATRLRLLAHFVVLKGHRSILRTLSHRAGMQKQSLKRASFKLGFQSQMSLWLGKSFAEINEMWKVSTHSRHSSNESLLLVQSEVNIWFMRLSIDLRLTLVRSVCYWCPGLLVALMTSWSTIYRSHVFNNDASAPENATRGIHKKERQFRCVGWVLAFLLETFFSAITCENSPCLGEMKKRCQCVWFQKKCLPIV